MTPAERLDAAAALLETTAHRTSDEGRWVRDGEEVRAIDDATYVRIATRLWEGDAAWIALLGPDKAPLLAAWLRDEARDSADSGTYHSAVAFADRILAGGAA